MVPTLRLSDARRAGRYDVGFLEVLRSALHGIGFVQLTDFGALPGQIDGLRTASKAFFDLPLGERMQVDNRRSPHFRGYTRLGHEITAGRSDSREQLDFAPEGKAIGPEGRDAPYRLLEGPNLWPVAALPGLRSTVLDWAALMSRVGAELTRAVAACIGLDHEHFDGYFSGAPHWYGKLIRYVGGPPDADAQGVGPHTDWGFLTLLLQDDVGGLQALPKGEHAWVDVAPVDDALVVNIGEMLEIATDGYLVATPHRVLPCPSGVTRESVAFFWSPRLDATLTRVALPPELAARAPGVAHAAGNALLSRFGDNALKGWLRSHPEVAELHHPALVDAPRSSRS
ncbi:MAG: 2OG-Fe(II) oxygenase [Pseudonocardia sp. SCN 72-86]|nr:MAG: 2OG-Fe(II) oxygenase [Pseudonocardia sp. SCN 72-86]